MTENEGNYAELNGLRMYYEVHGEGEPLILLHGGFGMTGMLDVIVQQLAINRKVIVADLQAHGRTTDIDRPLSRETPRTSTHKAIFPETRRVGGGGDLHFTIGYLRRAMTTLGASICVKTWHL